jgi:integrase
MASLHKNSLGRSPYWYCAYYGADGRRRFKSTKCVDRAEALRVCMAWEDAARQARKKTLTTAQVRRVFNEILEATGDEPLENFTIRSWFESWEADKRASRGTATADRYSKPARDFLGHLGKRADLPLRALNPRDVQGFRDAEVARGLSPVSVNLSHKVIASCLGRAVRQGYLKANPARGIDFLSVGSERTEKLTFSPEEIAALFEASPSRDWRGVILFGALAGLRLGDCLRLRWSNVDLANAVLTIIPAKTKRLGKKLILPLHPNLTTFLLEHPAGARDEDFLFPSIAGLGIGGKSGASMAFRRIMDRACVPAGVAREARGEAGRNVSQRSFHSLRHGFVTALSDGGVAVEVRQKLVGHTTVAQNLSYTHPDFNRLREAVGKVSITKNK